MKTIKGFAFMLVASLLFSTNAFAATEGGTPQQERQQLRAEVIKYIEKTNLEELDATARIKFMVTSRDEIVVLHVTTDSKLAERMIKSQLNYKKIKTDLSKKNQIYFIDVTFDIGG